MSHTPWEYHAKLTASENHRGYSITEGSVRIANVMPIDEDGIKGKEYARRIVACWNALADIPTESLEKMSMVSMPRELVEQRDQLAADNAILRTENASIKSIADVWHDKWTEFSRDNATLRAAIQTHEEDAAKLMAWLGQAHVLCSNLGVAPGHIEDRLFEAIGKANLLIEQRDGLLDRLTSLCNRIDEEGASPLDWPEYDASCAAITNATINISKTDTN